MLEEAYMKASGHAHMKWDEEQDYQPDTIVPLLLKGGEDRQDSALVDSEKGDGVTVDAARAP